jgi:capsular polysaccharide transport system permease protein
MESKSLIRVSLGRNSFRILINVYRALFLREALTRISSSRSAWFWLLAEPDFHVSYMLLIYTVIRVRIIGGIDTAIWLITGMLAFFMFRRTGMQVTKAIKANHALFSYRQVKPIDAVLVRGALEGYLMVLVACILLGGTALFGHSVIPADPLSVYEAFFGLWLMGMGFGLVGSVTSEIIPEFGKVIDFIMRPLYLLSGVILPLSSIPLPYQEWLMFNPLAHGLEAVRLGFSSNYHAVPELNISYLYGFSLVSIFLGLALHNRFSMRMVTQ